MNLSPQGFSSDAKNGGNQHEALLLVRVWDWDAIFKKRQSPRKRPAPIRSMEDRTFHRVEKRNVPLIDGFMKRGTVL